MSDRCKGCAKGTLRLRLEPNIAGMHMFVSLYSLCLLTVHIKVIKSLYTSSHYSVVCTQTLNTPPQTEGVRSMNLTLYG